MTPQVATVLKDIVEIDHTHVVTGIANDLDGAMASIEACPPELVLVDLHLTGNADRGRSRGARARAKRPDAVHDRQPLALSGSRAGARMPVQAV